MTLSRPILLAADNFTPLSRTPWAGDRIARLYKHQLVPEAAGRRVGESWEISCDSAFPSQVVGEGTDLLSLMRKNGEKVPDILVKLLDTADSLSLQVHPRDDDPNLAPGECGKPESWLVLAAEPGAGIYLGFSRSVTREELGRLLAQGDAARDVLHFEPVKPGDYFEIEPGVPHCIGKGVTLLEPQRVTPGMTGKTFRLYDFGRKYDPAGRLDPKTGSPRPLHLAEGLRLLDPERQVGAAYARTLRRDPVVSTPAPGLEIKAFPANPYYQVAALSARPGTSFTLDIAGGYGGLVVLKGRFAAAGLGFAQGQPALLPAGALPLSFQTEGEQGASAVIVAPASARMSFRK